MPLFSALGSGLMVPAPEAKASVHTLKLSHSTPVDHPVHLRLTEASRRIRADSGGAVDLEIYPLDQLGSQLDALGQVRSGGIDFMAISGLAFSGFLPVFAISATPFAFKDLRRVWAALDGGLGELLRDAILKTGTLFAAAPVLDSGFRQVTTSSRAVHRPADLDGLKIRVPPSASSVSLFRALGALPTVTNTSEIYSALQTGIVAGQENPLALIWSFRLYEVQRHCAVTQHQWDGLWLIGNRARFDRLPAAFRSLVTRHLGAAAMAEREDLAALNRVMRERLAGKGMQFTEPPVDAFHDRLRGANFYRGWRAKFTSTVWSRLESVVGPL